MTLKREGDITFPFIFINKKEKKCYIQKIGKIN